MISQLLFALLAVVLGIGLCALYFAGSNWLLDHLVGDRRRSDGTRVRRHSLRTRVRPWLFAGPALVVLAVYLAYPVVETFR
ncbi:MAG: hypothetical protein P8010_10560, partial [Desulfosarcinaceae bacterium]